MPGPGNYDGNSINVKKTEPAFKLGSESRFNTIDDKNKAFQ